METIEKLLRSELEEELEALGEAELGSDDYKVAVEGITKLMDRQIEISKLNSRRSVRASYDFDDVVFDTRGEADEVLSSMDELMDRYGVVSVADMYDLCGMTCNYTDNKYGWKSLARADISRVRDGYMIKLPKAEPI